MTNLTNRLAAAIRDALRNGKHPNVLEVKDIPGGLTEIESTFNLSIVAHACLAEIEKAGLKLVRA